MINKVGKVSISGISSSKIRGLDYTAPSIDSPARLSVTVFNTKNTFKNVNLSLRNATNVSIGGINMTMYPVEVVETHEGDGASSYKIEYVDGSFILDHYFVGLNGKHFNNSLYKFSTNHSNVILLGSPVDPCLTNNTVEKIKDPCSTCHSQDGNVLDVDCNQLRKDNLLDVTYNFAELINSIKNKGIGFKLGSGININHPYRDSFTGTLRSVLRDWCNLFGYSFVFEKGSIYMYNISSGVRINSGNLRNSNQTKSFSLKRSIVHTKSRGVISYFGKEAEMKSYDCNSDYHGKILCRPITLKDLVGNAEWKVGRGEFNAYNALLDSELSTLEIAATLSSYSKILRDAFVWFDAYGIRDASSARSNGVSTSFNPPRGNASLTGWSASGHALPLMQMTIKNAASSESTEYKAIYDSLDASIKESIEKYKSSGLEPYFFVASYSEKYHLSLLDWENSIGSDFLGKYFIRKYTSQSNVPPNFVAAESDSVEYYQRGTTKFPFNPLFPYQNGSSYLSELINYNPDDTSNLSDAFLLVTRSSYKIPSEYNMTLMNQLVDEVERHLPIRLNLVSQLFPNGDFPLKNSVTEKSFESSFDEGDYLYIGFSRSSGFNTSKMARGEHPDYKQFWYYYDPSQTPTTVGSITSSAPYFIFNSIKFWLPPQSSVTSDNGGYYVYYRSSLESNNQIYQPRAELVYQNLPSPSDIGNSMELEVSYENFQPIENDLYRRNPANNGCVYNLDNFAKEMVESVRGKNYSNAGVEHLEEVYDLDGLPSRDFSVEDGLAGISVRYDGKKIETTLTFSDFKDNDYKESDALKRFMKDYERSMRRGTKTVQIGTKGNTPNLI